MQIKSQGSCNQTSRGCAAMGAALSITYFAATPAPWCSSLCVPRLLDRGTGIRLGTGMRGAAETGANFSPKRQQKEITC